MRGTASTASHQLDGLAARGEGHHLVKGRTMSSLGFERQGPQRSREPDASIVEDARGPGRGGGGGPGCVGLADSLTHIELECGTAGQVGLSTLTVPAV